MKPAMMILRLSAAELWQAARTHQPEHFAGYWTAVLAEANNATTATHFGAVIAAQGIGGTPSGPPNGASFDGTGALTFEWRGNLACASSGQERYSVRITDAATGALVWESPFAPASTFNPGEAELGSIFGGVNRDLQWQVVSRDLTSPETGAYLGAGHVIVDAFDPPAMVAEASAGAAAPAAPAESASATRFTPVPASASVETSAAIVVPTDATAAGGTRLRWSDCPPGALSLAGNEGGPSALPDQRRSFSARAAY